MTFTALSALAEQFLALQRSTARCDPRQNGREVRALRHRETLLRSFLAYWRDRGCSWPIPSSLLLDWVAVGSDRQHPYRDQRRFYVARAFLQQVRTFEPATGIPENIYRPLCRRRTPHLFSDQEIQRLLEAVSQLRLYQPLRPLTLHTLIGLLASTGLRIGEAIALNVDDVKLDATPPHLLVQESKFGKSRCVVLHPSAAEHLRNYLRERQELLHGRKVEPLFTNRHGGHLDYNSQRLVFVRLLQRAGIKAVPGQRPPSLHSFRHTFAVKRLTLWHREHREVQQLLPHLAVYLGHLGPENTYWYVSSTPELLEAASALFENQYAVGGTGK
jgi:integrase